VAAAGAVAATDAGDRTTHLSADDIDAEEEELEMEKDADIDLIEGPNTTTIT
jgi:hypothetical protein